MDNHELNKKFWKYLIAYFPQYDTGHIENDASNNSSIVPCVFVTVVTFLPSRCLATTGGCLPSRRLATIRRLLPSHYLPTIGEIHRHTRTHTERATWSHKPTLFFQNKESKLIRPKSKRPKDIASISAHTNGLNHKNEIDCISVDRCRLLNTQQLHPSDR
jgi:hypothetical protein